MMKKILILALLIIPFFGCNGQGGFVVDTRPQITVTNNVVVTNNIGSGTSLVYNAVGPADAPFQFNLQLIDTNWAEAITPTNLILLLYHSKATGIGNMPSNFNFTSSAGTGAAIPLASKFNVIWGSTTALVASVDWRRETDYQLNQTYLYRIRDELSLGLTNAIPAETSVTIVNADNTVFTNIAYPFTVTTTSNRWNRAIHVSQLGYVPGQQKLFHVSRYEGTNVLETGFPAAQFNVYDVGGSTNITSGTLTTTVDRGTSYASPPNQRVMRGDFSALNKEGVYRITIAGMGVSTDFTINQNNFHEVLKLYELGEFNQRCGPATKGLPYSSWKSDWCHTNNNNFSIAVAASGQSNNLHWATIISAAADDAPNSATDPTPVWNVSHLLTGGFPALRPLFKWNGTSTGLNTQGGHHDAADYSKYTPNIELNCINLINTVDVIKCYDDDLGIPESGNGIPDLAEEAKWDADYLLKIIDSTGNVATNCGAAFLVYPSDKTYENNPPDVAQQQILYPETVTSTCQAGAALYVMGTSPTVKALWPDSATNYIAKAELCFGFVTNAITAYGATNAYDIVYNYSTFLGNRDQYASLYATRFLYTKDTNDLLRVKAWIPDFTAAEIKYFAWWPNYEDVGVACESIATSIQSGRVQKSDFGAELTTVFANCTNSIHQDALRQIDMASSNAFFIAYEFESKRVSTTPYWFNARMNKHLATDKALSKFHGGWVDNPTNMFVMIQGLNWDLGANPLNKSRIYGFGLGYIRTSVDQWGRFSNRQENGPTGAFSSSLQEGPSGGTYNAEVREIAWPKYVNAGENQAFPVTERHEDNYYLGGERTVDVMGMHVYERAAIDVFSRTNATIPQPKIVFSTAPQVGVVCTNTLFVPGVDTSTASFMWWASGDRQKTMRQYVWTPTAAGTNVTCEVRTLDARYYSISTNITVAP